MKILNGFAMLAIWLLLVFNKSNAQDKTQAGSKCHKQKQNDLVAENLKGKVKMILYGDLKPSDTVLPDKPGSLILYDTSGMWTVKVDNHWPNRKGGARITKRAFNSYGDLIMDISYNADSSAYQETNYTYRAHGVLMSVSGSKNKYDLQGRLMEGGGWVYKYDDEGNLVNLSNMDGIEELQRVIYIYDGNCRMTEEYDTIWYSCHTDKKMYKYDENNNLIEIRDEWYQDKDRGLGLVRYKYDYQGNELEEIYSNVRNDSIIPPFGNTYSYKYDDKGNWTEKDGFWGDGSIMWKEERRIIYY